MKKKILSLLILSNAIFAQEKVKKNWFTIDYLNMTSISINKNTDSNFSKYSKDNISKSNGGALDINTIQGIVICKYVSLSAGISVDWNINKTFLSTPVVFDFRLFSNKNREDCMFAYIQTGPNIKWSNSFDGNGVTAKLGVGRIFDYDDHLALYIDLFKKSKEIILVNFSNQGYYDADGFGISIGITYKI